MVKQDNYQGALALALSFYEGKAKAVVGLAGALKKRRQLVADKVGVAFFPVKLVHFALRHQRSWVIIASGYGMSPVWCQAITRSNADLLYPRQNRVRSVPSTILVGSVSYMHILAHLIKQLHKVSLLDLMPLNGHENALNCGH